MSVVALAGSMVAGSAAGHSSTREIVDLAVTEEQLHCPKVFRALIDQRRLGAAHGVRPVACRVQPQVLYPTMDDPGVLARSDVAMGIAATRKEEVARLESGLPDPGVERLPRWRRDLELHWPLRFALQHDCTGRNLVAMADITDT